MRLENASGLKTARIVTQTYTPRGVTSATAKFTKKIGKTTLAHAKKKKKKSKKSDL